MDVGSQLAVRQRKIWAFLTLIALVVTIGIVVSRLDMQDGPVQAVHQTSHTTKNSPVAADGDEKDNNNAMASSSDNAAKGKDVQFVTLQEWNVRFIVPQEFHDDVTYFMNERAQKDFGGPILVDITSKKFSDGPLKCAVVESTPRSLLSIERVKGTNFEDYSPRPFKVIDGYMYVLHETGCQEAVERDGTAQDKRLFAALKTAVTGTLERN